MKVIRRKNTDEITPENKDMTVRPVEEPQELELEFLENNDLKNLITEDYNEAKRSFQGKNYKAAILLCGSILEAILMDLIARKRPAETDAKNRNFKLSELIDATKKYHLITDEPLFLLLKPLRHYRNMIHPGVQVRMSLSADHSKASIALETIHMLVKHLSENSLSDTV